MGDSGWGGREDYGKEENRMRDVVMMESRGVKESKSEKKAQTAGR